MTEESVLVGPLYSAAEIGAMGLLGLPRTKTAIIARAKAEGWPFEERKDLGGTKRMYKVPAKYVKSKREGSRSTTPPQSQAVAGTIVRGSSKVDLDKLELAMTALSNWEKKRAVEIDTERRSAVLALLYDYLVLHANEGEEAMDRVLRALG